MAVPGAEAVANAPAGNGGAIETPGSATGSPDEGIARMEEAFNRAIYINAVITARKTELGATKTSVEQRPNIG